jgi:hypothetical protein
MKDIAVRLQNRPGTLAAAAAALHRAGIEIHGVCGFAIDGRGLRHLLVEDGEYVDALAEAGAELVEQRSVVVIPIEPTPGWLGAITARLGEAGVNIEVVYNATGNRLVIVPNDLAKARAALGV